ncbi:hypothetical protein FRACYDRAFT_236341 [Fragilariopsis cylindrus CCMP1102]|uniref:Uncharacterized protein n=1 Tax=Fragilariopsis cylindrus CCMP1102 TaxID=635003 RepID=A0A1E7FQ41_9STRA|nr:hypothetical protein FRACYDRAFT_236341 [Fragilariopsis cylindrus CCMP1102]|eukprot:OEU20268.1 hypothetical protein FRACYDRAFT_236341 [Fragilariopsis cylindrus CCMP1102]
MSEIANHNIDEYGAPPFMYVMLVPHAPYTVVGLILEIHPKAADYEHDVMSWIGWKKDSFFIEDIEPKSLRLIIETTKNERIASKGDMNYFCPIERFVDVDTENLTTQTKIILELQAHANMHVLDRHFFTRHYASYTKCKLGEPAFRFCSDLIKENRYGNYSAGSTVVENQIRPNTEAGAAEKRQRLSQIQVCAIGQYPPYKNTLCVHHGEHRGSWCALVCAVGTSAC